MISHFCTFSLRKLFSAKSRTINTCASREAMLVDNVRMSSAWRKPPAKKSFTDRPIPDRWRLMRRGFMTSKKRVGERTDPCFTPLPTTKGRISSPSWILTHAGAPRERPPAEKAWPREARRPNLLARCSMWVRHRVSGRVPLLRHRSRDFLTNTQVAGGPG